MVEDKEFRKAFDRYITELNLSNIALSLQKCNFKKIESSYYAVSTFGGIPVPIIHNKGHFYMKSAFITYHYEAFHQAYRSLLEALTGYYNASYILLRSTLELILKGAFWECIAHRKYRDNADIVSNLKRSVNGKKISLIDWLNSAINRKPTIADKLESNSVIIYDIISPLLETDSFTKIMPTIKVIIQQLEKWSIFDPIPDPLQYVYDIYKELSADVHVTPKNITIGRRAYNDKNLFAPEIIPQEMDKYAKTLQMVMDIGIVVELNVLGDIIDEESKDDLRPFLISKIFNTMDLKYGYQKIEKIVATKVMKSD